MNAAVRQTLINDKLIKEINSATKLNVPTNDKLANTKIR